MGGTETRTVCARIASYFYNLIPQACAMPSSLRKIALCRNNIKLFSQCTSSLPHGPFIRLVTLMVLLLARFILLNFINCLTVGLPLRRDGIKGQDGKTGKDYDPRDTSKLTLGVVRGPVFALGISVSLNPAVSTLKVTSYNIGIIYSHTAV